jgi:hypothetical protein
MENTTEALRALHAPVCSVSAILTASFAGCEAGCLSCGEVNDIAAGMRCRVRELEQAIVNIYRWTGSKRCARECKRVLPNVAQLSKPNVKTVATCATGDTNEGKDS